MTDTTTPGTEPKSIPCKRAAFWRDQFGNEESHFEDWMQEEMGLGVKWRAVFDPLASPQAAPAPSEAEQVCAEAYQVVGCMLSDLGLFGTDRAEKILDNLSQHRMVHADVLPWPSVEGASKPTAEPIASGEPVSIETSGLLPCPFCGGKAVCEMEGPHSWGIWCEGCDAHGSSVHFDEENARKCWNLRAPITPPPTAEPLTDALVERITAYLSGGGLFNPELADHNAVRDLLVDCRAILAAQGSKA